MRKYSVVLSRFINADEVHSYYKNKLHEIIQENEKYDIEFSENMAIVHVAATKGLDVIEVREMLGGKR